VLCQQLQWSWTVVDLRRYQRALKPRSLGVPSMCKDPSVLLLETLPPPDESSTLHEVEDGKQSMAPDRDVPK
jgi:hypothetical protein